jgi:hypothetical protein
MANDTSNNPFAKLGSTKLDTSLTRSTRLQPAQEIILENQKQAIPQHLHTEQANARTPERANGKRITTRESFDIYEDQMASLRKISYLEKMEGKLGSMSAMVREALDAYLTKRTSEE